MFVINVDCEFQGNIERRVMASLSLSKYVNLDIHNSTLTPHKVLDMFYIWTRFISSYITKLQIFKNSRFLPTLLNIIVLLIGLIAVGRLHVMFDIHLILSLIFCIKKLFILLDQTTRGFI